MRLRPDRDPSLSRLRALSLFSACSDRELRLVRALTTQVDIRAGYVLVDPARWERQVFVVAEGTAETRSGARVLNRLGPGTVFGELAIGPPAEPLAEVFAATHMIVFVLTPLEWRSLPQHLRVTADDLRVKSTRLLRADAQFSPAMQAWTASPNRRDVGNRCAGRTP